MGNRCMIVHQAYQILEDLGMAIFRAEIVEKGCGVHQFNLIAQAEGRGILNESGMHFLILHIST